MYRTLRYNSNHASTKLSTFRGAYGVTLVLGSNNWALLKHIVGIFYKMGQDQSRDANIITLPASPALPSPPPDLWVPHEMDALVVLRRRADGSSVKELYIPEWQIAFFKVNSSIDILTDCASVTGGKKVRISAENALILYNAWIIHVDSKRVLNSTMPFVSEYLDSNTAKY